MSVAEVSERAAVGDHAPAAESEAAAFFVPSPGDGATRPAAAPGTVTTVVTGALLTLAVILLGLVLNLVLVSRLEHRVAQVHQFDKFRNALANGVAPVGGVSAGGQYLARGTPIALLKIPSIHVSEVVGEGTTSADLMKGPGHLRSTTFPGQAGASVVLGRQAAYGGPFGSISTLKRGAKVIVTTQVGQTVYTVKDVRHAGDRYQPLTAGDGRLILETASGTRFLPSALVYVDADTSSPAPAAAIPSGAVGASERPLGTDTSGLGQLAFLVEFLVIILFAATWAVHRWGRTRAWIVSAPPTILLAYLISAQVTQLLPNLL